MKIPFEREYRQRYYSLLEEMFDSNFLSEGQHVKAFEQQFSLMLEGLQAVAVCNCGLGLMAVFEHLDVRGKEVVVPTNTFMATALAARKAGAKVVYADADPKDLCLSLESVKAAVTPDTAAVVVVHIGGHIAFEIEEIAAYLAERGIPLVEDCAHAHGATFHGRHAGSYGVAGVYSFYATKTMPLGEGGMVVTHDPALATWVADWRNYGKFDYVVEGLNARMNEMTAALGLVQLERLPMILEWKRNLAAKYDRIFPNRVMLPKGMCSGYYKYIVFDEPLAEKTGAVFDRLCHEIDGVEASFPGAEWIRDHHACPPIYHGWDGADLDAQALAARLRG